MMAKQKHPPVSTIRPRMTVLEVAAVLRCSDDAIYKWAHDGSLPYIPVGKRGLRFDPDVIEAIARGERPLVPSKPTKGNVVKLRPDDG